MVATGEHASMTLSQARRHAEPPLVEDEDEDENDDDDDDDNDDDSAADT